jgi:hypothetical protein
LVGKAEAYLTLHTVHRRGVAHHAICSV